MPLPTDFRRAGPTSAFTAGRPHPATVGGVDVVVVRGPTGELRAYDARCPHQGTLLSEGELTAGELVCRAHGWRFEADTGARRGKPCLTAFPVEVRGDDLWLAVPVAAPEAQSTTRRLPDLPGPRGLPLLGNLLDLDARRIHQVYEAWAREFGPYYTYRFGRRPVLVVSEAQVAEDILRARPATFRRMSAIETIFEELGVHGVFSAEGEEWRRQRRLAMEALANRHLKNFYPTLEKVAERLKARWTRTAGEVIDLQDDLMRFTVDVTTSLAFSVDMNTLDGGEEVIQRHLELLFPAINRRLVSPLPYWQYVKLPADRALDRALREIWALLGRLVDETRANLELRRPGDREPTNFLEAMLLARDEDGAPFSDRVIHGNALTMLLAGEDTTANTIAWLVHEVLEQRDVALRLRAEADRELGARAVPTLEATQRLPYADAVAQETMRLRPVAPLLFLETLEPTVVGDVAVDKEQLVIPLLRTIAKSPENFGDPERFAPERWLDERPADRAHAARAHLPFGSGPRICPGRSLALLEMRLVVATLFKNFEVERAGSAAEVEEDFTFTMAPKGLRVRLTPRGVAG